MPAVRHAVSQTLLYGFSIAIMKGISILMLPFIAHYLTQEAFGRLEVLSSFAIVASILVGLGLEDTLYRFAGQADSRMERKRIAARIFGLTLLAGTLVLALGWITAVELGRWLPGDIETYELQLVFVVLALEGAIAVPMGWLRMQNRAVAFFTLSVARAAMQATLILVMLQPGSDITPVLEAGAIAAGVQALALGWLQFRDTGIALKPGPEGSLVGYSLPIVGSGLIAFVLNGLDRWIIADHVGLAEVAEYGVASKFALAAVLLLQPFGMWWSPKRFEIIARPGGSQSAATIIAVGISLCLVVCVGVGTGAPVLIGLLMPSEYVLAASFTLGLVLAMTLREITELVNIGCYMSRSTLTQLWINLAASIVGLGVMLTGVADLGVWGVILALVIAQSIRLVLFFRASQSFHRLHYPLARLGFLGLQAIAWLSFSTLIEGLLQQLAYACLASAAMAASVVLLKLVPVPVKRQASAAATGVPEC